MAIQERNHRGRGWGRGKAVVRRGRAPGGMEAGLSKRQLGGQKSETPLQAFGSCCLVPEVSEEQVAGHRNGSAFGVA